ncbi:biopolymer transporter ExbD [bacterium]|nr:biopolymer transporter ExbD [bacterium]
MPSRYREKRERREPEKTPLIDVIFLLLIFFFVTVVNLDVTPKPTYGSRQAGSQPKLDLLPMTNPMEQSPDSLNSAVLIQIQPVDDLEEALIARFNETFGDLNGVGDRELGNQILLAPGQFAIFVLDENYQDLTAVQGILTGLRSAISSFRLTNQIALKNQIMSDSRYLPINLPSQGAPNFQSSYERAIFELRTRLSGYFGTPRAREVHIRMDPQVYVKIIEDLFQICNEERVQVENIKFRVIEQRT